MACSCYDEFAALYAKFETIWDLCEQVCAKVCVTSAPRPGAGREAGPRLDDDPWFYAKRDDEEFIGLLMAIAPIIFD